MKANLCVPWRVLWLWIPSLWIPSLCVSSVWVVGCSSASVGEPKFATRAQAQPAAPASDLRLPLRGNPHAQLTLISILDPQSAGGRSMFNTLDLLQRRVGLKELRWILLAPMQADGTGDPIGAALQKHAAGSARFAYLEALNRRAAMGGELGFAERLQLGLQVAQRAPNAEPGSGAPPDAEAERAVDQLTLELDTEIAELASRGNSVSLISLNGIHIRGLASPAELERLARAELAIARKLTKSGTSAQNLFAQRINANHERFIDHEATRPSDEPAEDPEGAPEIQPLEEDAEDFEIGRDEASERAFVPGRLL